MLARIFSLAGHACLCLILTGLFAGFAQAKPELGPPSIKLRAQLSNVTLAELESIGADHSLQFNTEKNIHNTAEESVMVRSDALTTSSLVEGNTYVIAFGSMISERNPITQTSPRTTRPRKDGAVILSMRGATPAIFPPNENLIELLSWDLESSEQSPDAMLPIILNGMAEADQQLQNFFATELVTRPELHSELSRKDKRTIADYMGDIAYSPQARDLMLGDSEFSSSVLREKARLEIARDIVGSHPEQIDFGSHHGGLIRTSMRIIESNPNESDVLEMQRWLRSNQPALIESAAEIIFEHDPGSLTRELEKASGYTLLEQQSRDTLKNLIQRYSRLVAES